jgi:hypothetical protein
MTLTLDQEFERELVRTYKVSAQHGYTATYFIQLLGERGGAGRGSPSLLTQAASKLIQTSDGPGLFRCGKLIPNVLRLSELGGRRAQCLHTLRRLPPLSAWNWNARRVNGE